MFISASTLAALACIPAVLAHWQDCASGILQALNASGFNRFANATASLNGTSGQYILTELSQGNKIIFAPTDDALSSANHATIYNETSLANLIAYHIVSSDFINQTETYPNVTIGRTLLNATDLVMLEGNKSQVLVWSKSDNGSFFVMNQGSNITVVNTTFYNDTTIMAIDDVLTPPPNISAILSNASYDLTSVADILRSATLPNGPSLLDVLSSAHGVTVFAPNNAGVHAAQSSLAGISNNATAVLNVVSSHIINGTSVYSTEISNGTTLVSAGGQDYAFFANSTGDFVSVGGTNQVQILKMNVLASNGVIHIVNGVMLDTNSDAALASAAYASATSVAEYITETGPITGTFAPIAPITSAPTSSESSPTTSSSVTSTPTSAGTARGEDNNWKLGVLAGMVVGLGPFV